MRVSTDVAAPVWLMALVLPIVVACPVAVAPLDDLDFVCRASAECAPGYVCVDGTCQPGNTAPGSDAAELDAAAPDGAAADVAVADAGVLDATNPDVTVDASTADGSTADVSTADVSTADASTADAATSCDPDWWDCAWSGRLKLTFDNSQQDEDLVAFPVLVMLRPSRVDLTLIASGGADIRFVDPDGDQPLAYEIERWVDDVAAWIWVKVPRIDAQSTSDHIWMYYGNSGASDAQEPSAVWSEGFRAVWHLDTTAGSSIQLPGSSPSMSRQGARVDGVASRGLGLDGVSDRVLFTASDSVLGSLESITVSAWVRRDELGNGWRGIFSAHHGEENDHDSGNFVFHAQGDQFGLENNNPFNNTWLTEVDAPRQWHQLTMVVDSASDRGLLYLDGREVERWDGASGTPTWNDQDEVRLGARWHNQAEQNYLSGSMDEVRVAHVARSAAWLRAQYLAQSDALIRYGEEAWLRPAFGHRVKLRFVSADQQENLVDFPVLVTLTGDVIDYALVQSGGEDLRFLDADGRVLAHELDDWNHGGLSQIWVRVPQINAYNITDHIWLYYDNPAVGGAEDASAVWSDDYVGVWHLSDHEDSTANTNNGVNHGTASAAGVVAGAIDVDNDGDGERVEVADSPSLDEVREELTASLWMYREADEADWGAGIAREMNETYRDLYWLGFHDHEHMFITSREGVERFLNPISPLPPLQQWYYLAGTYNGRKMRIYVDGEEIAESEETGALQAEDNPLTMGGNTNDHGASWVDQPEGFLDEARLQRVARGHAWMRAAYWSMSDALILLDTPQPR